MNTLTRGINYKVVFFGIKRKKGGILSKEGGMNNNYMLNTLV